MTPPRIFDRLLLQTRARRAAALGPATFLAERVADDLAERLSAILRTFPLALDLGSPTAHVVARLRGNPAIGRLIRLAPRDADVVGADDALPFAPESLDLVVSALALQAVDDLPGALIQIRRVLKPDGLLLAALLGGETLTELRQSLAQAESEIEGGVSPRVAPFAEVRALGTLLQRAGFALPVTDVDHLVARYATPFALMHDLRRMGATNALVQRSRKPLRRATLARMAEIYADNFSDADGRVRATFDIAWLSGWAPHERQQQPLRPGSAKTRLADALGVAERPAGEKVGR